MSLFGVVSCTIICSDAGISVTPVNSIETVKMLTHSCLWSLKRNTYFDGKS